MGLSNKKEEQLRKMPRIESKIRKSKDGRFIIQRTIITNIKPSAYYQKILDGNYDIKVSEEDFDDTDFFIQEGTQMEG